MWELNLWGILMMKSWLEAGQRVKKKMPRDYWAPQLTDPNVSPMVSLGYRDNGSF